MRKERRSISTVILLKEASDSWFISLEFDKILILYLIYIKMGKLITINY